MVQSLRWQLKVATLSAVTGTPVASLGRSHIAEVAPEMTRLSAALSLADRIAGGIGVLDRPISAHDLIEKAERRAGNARFLDRSFADPLQRFLASCVEEARLSVFGRIATRWDVAHFLSNLLRLEQEESKDPSILDETIDRPIFITGLPRSGTTFLYKLLTQDPANDAPRVYQINHPYPLSEKAAEPDPRIALANRQLRIFDHLAPEFRGLHPLDATSPQECSEITAHVFASLRFDSTYNIPSYRDWLDENGHVAAYRFHKRFLQHLQRQSGPRRWILKCPDHIFALDAIRAVYPDARIVFVHRDPLKVLASVARLTEVIRRPFTRHIDRVDLGRQESARWFDGTERMIRAAEERGFAETICHIWYTDLVAEPAQTIQGMYAHFGLTPSEEMLRRIAAANVATPNGGYGRHQYRLADHGLDPDTERQKFSRYMRVFGIVPERGPDSGAGPDLSNNGFRTDASVHYSTGTAGTE